MFDVVKKIRFSLQVKKLVATGCSVPQQHRRAGRRERRTQREVLLREAERGNVSVGVKEVVLFGNFNWFIHAARFAVVRGGWRLRKERFVTCEQMQGALGRTSAEIHKDSVQECF